MPIQPIYSPSQSSLRNYLSQWPKTLKSLDLFLLSLRLGDYNNPFASDSASVPSNPGRSPAFRPMDSGDVNVESDGATGLQQSGSNDDDG